jgi:RNase adaptor protein for sRNA GlmZ degradation
MKANGLREWVRQFIEAEPGQGLTLMFESFGFKHGIPLDADLVFDVRCLPNPHYDPELRPLTGKDKPVIVFSKPRRKSAACATTSTASSPPGCPATSATTATT